jgi:arylsulfatase A-like enzyme
LIQPVWARWRAGSRPSVILVSFDTLRADRVGVMGCPRPLTPNLDELAGEGALFEQASAASSWTLPSHVSVFSSLLPFDHGTRGHFDRIRLSDTFVAEHFREFGYDCAAFAGGGYLSSVYGYAQGCQSFEDHDEVAEGGPGVIAASALEWARAHRGSPFFLFVHTYEPHLPYTHSEFATPGKVGRIERTLDAEQDYAIHDGRLVLTPEERARVRDLCDSDVAYADRVIGGMLRTMKSEGILDDAILLVFSDHGDDLWDHDQTWSPGHGHTLYEEVLHALFFVRAPGLVPAGGRIRTPVSLLDVGPTLLGLAGLPGDPAYQGRDLSASCRQGVEPPVALVRAESMQFGPDRFALRQGNLKVILVPTPGRRVSEKVIDPAPPLEIFDLGADPGERNNLAGAVPDSIRSLVRLAVERADEVLFSGQSRRGQQRTLPSELLEQLRSLGYVN